MNNSKTEAAINMEQLREWLEQKGFFFAKNPFHDETNSCDWYAWRRSKLPARDCDCNGPKIQIVLIPYSYNYNGQQRESIEIDVTGEHNGVWYKLQAYSLTPAELIARLDEIETKLVKAWNSL
jgi:hypothetical protein